MDEYGLRREDIFVSTKLWNDNRGYDKAMKAFEVSLKKLGLEYLESCVIHTVNARFYVYPPKKKSDILYLVTDNSRTIVYNYFYTS